MSDNRKLNSSHKRSAHKKSGKRGKREENGRQSRKSRSSSVNSHNDDDDLKTQQLSAQIRQLEATVKEMKNLNNAWYDKCNNLENAFKLLTVDYGTLKDIIYENGDVYKFNTDSISIEDVDHDMVVRMLRDICHCAKNPPTLEMRLEEMETRITKQNTEAAYLMENNLLYENVLKDIYNTRDTDYIHDKIADTFIQTGKTAKDIPLSPIIIINEDTPLEIQQLPSPPSLPSTFKRFQQRRQDVALIPPIKRMAGTTHILNMNVDLKLYICRDLNLERKSTSDWRLLAKRVGIPQETIDHWRHLKLVSPMNRVLAVWGQSENATIRMLHRHLSSPEMNAILLVRKIEDFYDV